ncbi:MAG TPA: alpha/beta fold hydrolase [Candidatus Binatia bacterium]|nr:alpha/beta fold hydrolase [Candidatus Binatia bacterium]
MDKRAPLPIDLYSPERQKYKAPLILLHGLWSSSLCWMPWATHFANLGWECRAVNLPGRFGADAAAELKRLRFEECVSDVREVLRAAPFPPVVVAHDLGALIALKALEGEKASAVVLLAPLPPAELLPELPRALKLLRLKYSALMLLRRPFRIEAGDFHKLWLGAPARDGADTECLVADAPALIQTFFARRVHFAWGKSRFPILIAAARDDCVVPQDALGALAARLGAELREVPGGHWLIGEQGGAETVREVHRWIVQKIGGEILLEPPPRAAAE